MGWCKSPPFFCAASETARDVIEALLLCRIKNTGTSVWGRNAQRGHCFSTILSLSNDYFHQPGGSFCQWFHRRNKQPKRRTSHALLTSNALWCSLDFPTTGNIKTSRTRSNFTKEIETRRRNVGYKILRWLVNIAKVTLQLMPEKCSKILKLIKKVCKQTLPPPKIPRTCRKAPTHIIWNTRRKMSLLTDPRSHKNHDKEGLSDAALKSNPQRLENPSESPRKKPNASTTSCIKLPKLHPMHGRMRTRSRGSHHTRTGCHPILGMAIRHWKMNQ